MRSIVSTTPRGPATELREAVQETTRQAQHETEEGKGNQVDLETAKQAQREWFESDGKDNAALERLRTDMSGFCSTMQIGLWIKQLKEESLPRHLEEKYGPNPT